MAWQQIAFPAKRAIRRAAFTNFFIGLGFALLPRVGSVTFAENEERSPWEPFHVQHGLAPGDSAVSVFTGCRSTAFTLGPPGMRNRTARSSTAV